MLRARTVIPKPNEVSREWHLMNAEGQVLGRLASRAALLLRGKHKPTFTPHMDCGDSVVVVNAEKILVTGNKLDQKIYRRYSGYPSGLKEESLRRLLNRRPAEVVRRAVAGMLPKGPLGNRLEKHLHVYAGPDHPHSPQLKKAGAKE